MFTFFDVDHHFAEVEAVDVVRRESLYAHEPTPDGVAARHVDGPWRHDGSGMIAAEAVERCRGVAQSHFDVSHTIR